METQRNQKEQNQKNINTGNKARQEDKSRESGQRKDQQPQRNQPQQGFQDPGYQRKTSNSQDRSVNQNARRSVDEDDEEFDTSNRSGNRSERPETRP